MVIVEKYNFRYYIKKKKTHTKTKYTLFKVLRENILQNLAKELFFLILLIGDKKLLYSKPHQLLLWLQVEV